MRLGASRKDHESVQEAMCGCAVDIDPMGML